MVFDGKSKAVPRTMLPACCDVTITLDPLRPDAVARPDLYLRFRCPVNIINTNIVIIVVVIIIIILIRVVIIVI